MEFSTLKLKNKQLFFPITASIEVSSTDRVFMCFATVRRKY